MGYGTRYRDVSCGVDYSLGITAEGVGVEWGDPLSEFRKTKFPREFIYLFMQAGYSHSCGVTEKEELLCWGHGERSRPQ